jgi:hypothetical protein
VLKPIAVLSYRITKIVKAVAVSAREKRLENQINKIKEKLMTIGEMRPGSLSKQYNVCGVQGCRCKDPVNPKRHGPYFQLSFVHKRKSTTRFIRRHQLVDVRAQVARYKKFKLLTEKWIELALAHAESRLAATRDKTRNEAAK